MPTVAQGAGKNILAGSTVLVQVRGEAARPLRKYTYSPTHSRVHGNGEHKAKTLCYPVPVREGTLWICVMILVAWRLAQIDGACPVLEAYIADAISRVEAMMRRADAKYPASNERRVVPRKHSA